MKVSEFADKVTRIEGKRKSISVAQVKEVLKIVNELLDGKVYKLIRREL